MHQYETSVLDKNGNREFIFGLSHPSTISSMLPKRAMTCSSLLVISSTVRFAEQGDAGHDMAVIADGE